LFTDIANKPQAMPQLVEHVTPAKVTGTDFATGRSDKVIDMGRP
jgi:hypothetical protein